VQQFIHIKLKMKKEPMRNTILPQLQDKLSNFSKIEKNFQPFELICGKESRMLMIGLGFLIPQPMLIEYDEEKLLQRL
jgi:hypothetical protein